MLRMSRAEAAVLISVRIGKAKNTIDRCYLVMSLKVMDPGHHLVVACVDELVPIIMAAKIDYYKYGTSELSDTDYDFYEKTIRVISPGHQVLENVGYEDDSDE
jgi:hypothetical protein